MNIGIEKKGAKSARRALGLKSTSIEDQKTLARLTKKLDIHLEALKQSETITSEMLSRRVTI